jgi:pimeloyl-ACP methyl ester carboxylesterase
MSELLDAIVRAVQDHGFESADVIGSSFGGWVAQCFARQNPGSVRRLVLSHTFVLRPSDAWKFRVALRVWRATPEWLLRSLISLRVRRSLAPLNRERTRDRYIETLTHVRSTLDAPEGLDMLMNQNACMLDSLTNASGVATPRQAGHPVLILESTDDPLISPSARRDLRAIYPDAIVHRFTGSGHVSALVDPDAFAGVVGRFLDQP